MSRILGYEDLKARGIPFSASHIHYLAKKGKFPKPIKFGHSTKGWVEAEINEYLASKIAERDAVSAEQL